MWNWMGVPADVGVGADWPTVTLNIMLIRPNIRIINGWGWGW